MLCWCGLGVVSELSPAPATNAACRIRAPRRRLPVGISSTIGALPLASPVKPKPCGRRHSSPSTANRWPTSSPMSGVVTTTAQTRPLGERTSRELTGGALAGSPCGATRSPDPYPVGPPTLRGRRTATRANAAGRRRSERSPPWSCRHRCRSRARTRAQRHAPGRARAARDRGDEAADELGRRPALGRDSTAVLIHLHPRYNDLLCIPGRRSSRSRRQSHSRRSSECSPTATTARSARRFGEPATCSSASRTAPAVTATNRQQHEQAQRSD
jgi:hypothetical protein